MRFRRGPLRLACSVLALVVVACTGTGASPAPAGTIAPTATPGPSPIYDPAADPSAEIAAALTAAAMDGRPVLLDFGADWCPDCVVLTRMLEMPEFADYLLSVHVVRIDVGTWDHNLDVAKAYGDPIATGIPAVVLLSPQGKVLGSTADGRLASAASMKPVDVLRILTSLGG